MNLKADTVPQAVTDTDMSTPDSTHSDHDPSNPFGSVVGQDRPKRILARLAESGAVPHALLFCGPDGTGRTAAAFAFIKTLYAREAGTRGMGRIDRLSHPDFSVLFPLTARGRQNEQEILLRLIRDPYGSLRPENAALHAIENVRDLKHRFSRSAFEGGRRSTVILHAEKMRAVQASALLKILEEPPEGTVMVLTAPSPDALLPTIVSRCQVIRFQHLPEPVIVDTLAALLGMESSAASFIARVCGGSFRRALEMATDTSDDDLHGGALRFLESLLWGDPYRTYTRIEELTADRERTLAILSAATLWLREVLLLKAGAEGSDDASKDPALAKIANAFQVGHLQESLADIERLREMNRRNVNLHAGVVTLWHRIRSFAEGVPA